MNVRVNTDESKSKGTRLEKAGALDVLLACEDYASGMHALRTFDELFPVNESGQPAGRRSVWKFELLQITSLREAAAEEAAAAELVIISAHAPGQFPKAVKSWLDLWMKKRPGNQGALVLLLDDAGHDSHQPLPVEDYLQKLATSAGMTFAAHKAAGRQSFSDLELAMGTRKTPEALRDLKELLPAERGPAQNSEIAWMRMK
jgi:hypothetical protein